MQGTVVNDVDFELDLVREKAHFRYRVAALLVRDQKLLVSTIESEKTFYWTLGGGVQVGELAQDALAREVWEETGLTVSSSKLIGIVENIVSAADPKYKDYLIHQVALYFVIDVEENINTDQILEFESGGGGNDREYQVWVPLDSLLEYEGKKIFPDAVAETFGEKLRTSHFDPVHVVQTDSALVKQGNLLNTDACVKLSDLKKWARCRAVALIVHNDHLLLARNSSSPYYYTVGGGVHVGETTSEALQREVYEEAGFELKNFSLFSVVENIFLGTESVLEGYTCHELGFYYFAEIDGDYDVHKIINTGETTSDGIEEFLEWVPLDSLDGYKGLPVLPSIVGSTFAEKLNNQDYKFIHVAHQENKPHEPSDF